MMEVITNYPHRHTRLQKKIVQGLFRALKIQATPHLNHLHPHEVLAKKAGLFCPRLSEVHVQGESTSLLLGLS